LLPKGDSPSSSRVCSPLLEEEKDYYSAPRKRFLMGKKGGGIGGEATIAEGTA